MSTENAEPDDHRAARRQHDLSTLRGQVEDARAVLLARGTGESRAVARLFAHSLRRVEDSFRGNQRVSLLPMHLRQAAAEVVKNHS